MNKIDNMKKQIDMQNDITPSLQWSFDHLCNYLHTISVVN